MTKRRVVIFHHGGDTLNNPTMTEIVKSLLENGTEVTLVTHPGRFLPDKRDGLELITRSAIVAFLQKVVFTKLNSVWLTYLFTFLLLQFRPWARSDVVIGVDREGLIEASIYAKRLNLRPHYISFEIMFADETSARFKRPEIRASRNLESVWVQDPERARLLCEENQIPWEKVRLIPLASKGLGETSEARLRDDLGIPPEKKVALMMGSIEAWTGADDVLAGVQYWPNDWVLLVHGRFGSDSLLLPPLARSMVGARIFLSNHSFPDVSKMGKLTAGVDAGIAFYIPQRGSRYLGKNIAHIGLASGKISTLLRYRIPVITNVTGELGRLIEKHGAGAVIRDARELPRYLTKMNQKASSGASAVFGTNLDYEIYEHLVLDGFLDPNGGVN